MNFSDAILAFSFVANAIMIVLLARNLLSTDKLQRSLEASRDEATMREQEYARAHRHYTQLIRHRIMNPVTVIRGAAITLQPRNGVNLDADTRSVLLDAVLEASDAIEQATFGPMQIDCNEADLDAIPRLPPQIHAIAV